MEAIQLPVKRNTTIQELTQKNELQNFLKGGLKEISILYSLHWPHYKIIEILEKIVAFFNFSRSKFYLNTVEVKAQIVPKHI